MSSRVTLNYGMRWEPYFGQNVRNGVISVFNMDNFTEERAEQGVPQGARGCACMPGDAGFPNNEKTGMNKQWWEPVATRRRRVGRTSATAGWRFARRTRWPTTSWRASITTSTRTRRRSVTGRS